jgi:hypothetical protein
MSLLWARADRSTPADFQDDYYIYVPNLPAAIVALVLWAIVLSGIVYRSYRFKVWYLTVMVVGLVSMNPALLGAANPSKWSLWDTFCECTDTFILMHTIRML